MVRIEMLAVGKELLIGRTLNTNAHWLGGRLARQGAMLKVVTTTDDDLDEISSALQAILRRSPDFLVVVGGLGPTPDDMTLKGLAAGLGRGLREDPNALGLILDHYKKRGMPDVKLTPARKKMAVLPRGSTALPNEDGTAPGVRMVSGGTVIFSLPGVPTEMKSIYRRSVEPEIRARVGRLFRKYVKMKFEGMPESVLAPMIGKVLKEHPEAYVKSHPRGVKGGISRVELDVAVVGKEKKKTDAEGEEVADELAAMVKAGGATVVRLSGRGRG